MFARIMAGIILGVSVQIMPAFAQDQPLSIERINTQWNEAFDQGNTAALADLYTEDAVLVPPTDRMITGLAEVEKFWRILIWAGITARETRTERVEVIGDTAFTTGTWEGTGPNQQGTRSTYRGNVIRVLERQPDGTWKTRLHTWNIIP